MAEYYDVINSGLLLVVLSYLLSLISPNRMHYIPHKRGRLMLSITIFTYVACYFKTNLSSEQAASYIVFATAVLPLAFENFQSYRISVLSLLAFVLTAAMNFGDLFQIKSSQASFLIMLGIVFFFIFSYVKLKVGIQRIKLYDIAILAFVCIIAYNNWEYIKYYVLIVAAGAIISWVLIKLYHWSGNYVSENIAWTPILVNAIPISLVMVGFSSVGL